MLSPETKSPSENQLKPRILSVLFKPRILVDSFELLTRYNYYDCDCIPFKTSLDMYLENNRLECLIVVMNTYVLDSTSPYSILPKC